MKSVLVLVLLACSIAVAHCDVYQDTTTTDPPTEPTTTTDQPTELTTTTDLPTEPTTTDQPTTWRPETTTPGGSASVNPLSSALLLSVISTVLLTC